MSDLHPQFISTVREMFSYADKVSMTSKWETLFIRSESLSSIYINPTDFWKKYPFECSSSVLLLKICSWQNWIILESCLFHFSSCSIHFQLHFYDLQALAFVSVQNTTKIAKYRRHLNFFLRFYTFRSELRIKSLVFLKPCEVL